MKRVDVDKNLAVELGHEHIMVDGEIVHRHPHKHSHTQTKRVANRLARLIGHLQSVVSSSRTTWNTASWKRCSMRTGRL